jgi:hypothetical protein
MNNFLRLTAGPSLDTMPLLHALATQPDLWNANTYRTRYKNTPHGEVDDVWLRYSRPDSTANEAETAKAQDDTSPVWYPAAARLPQVKPLALMLMRSVDGYELGRVLITRVRPGARILAHKDTDGEYVNEADRQRYHIVLQGLPGSLFHCGDETVQMLTGEAWWFDARQTHAVENNSADDRIHLIIDLRLWPT